MLLQKPKRTPDRIKRDYVYCLGGLDDSSCGKPDGDSDVNLAVWHNPADPTNNDTGYPMATPHACSAWANYRPFSSIPHPSDYAGVIIPQGTNIVLRYLAKWPSTDGSGYYAMIKAPSSASPYAKWVFVPWTCLLP